MPQAHTRKFVVGQILTAAVHCSISDYDTSRYEKNPMIVSGKPLYEKLVVVKIGTRGRVTVREIDATYDTPCQAVRGGFYQPVYGPSIAYKFKK